LRRTAARSVDAVCDAIAHILAMYSQAECSEHIKDAGYAQTEKRKAQVARWRRQPSAIRKSSQNVYNRS
jgi:hypothetical protein